MCERLFLSGFIYLFSFQKTLKKFEKKRFAKGKTLIFRIETGAKQMDESLFRTKK